MFKNPILKALSSLKLAIFLLLTLAATSIIGTILPQGQPLMFYVRHYGPSMAKIIEFLQLYNAYHSWWYISLLLFFSLNLILCSIKRFPFSWELYKRDPVVGLEKLSKMPLVKKLTCKQFPEDGEKKVEEIARQKLGNIKKVSSFQEGTLFISDKARWSYFSVYVVHLSFLLVLIGAIIGAFWGFKGSIILLEGTGTDKVIIEGKQRRFIPLPFEIRCKKFSIDFYPNGMPKEYTSEVEIWENGKKVKEKTIEVNAPLKYKGITFYQASYQTYAQAQIKVSLDSKEKILTVRPFSQGEWKEENIRLGAMNFAQAHGLAAARLWISIGDEPPRAFWVLAQHPKKIPTPKGTLTILLEKVSPVYATGLQVKKDPGVIVVWMGFIFLILGIFAAFLFSHQCYWIAIVPEKGKKKIIVAAMASKNKETARKKVEELSEELLSTCVDSNHSPS